MQTIADIRELLREYGISPKKRFGQNFLHDQNQVRKLLARFKPIDLSNEKLFRQNVLLVIERIKKIVLPLELKH